MYVSASVHTNMCGRHVHKARTCMQAAIIKTTCALSRYDAHCYQYRNAISTASSSSDKRTGCYSSAVVIANCSSSSDSCTLPLRKATSYTSFYDLSMLSLCAGLSYIASITCYLCAVS